MAKTIKDFLEDLATDPDLAEEFESSPVAAMIGYGLSRPDRRFILNATPQQLRAKLKAAGVDAFVIRVKRG